MGRNPAKTSLGSGAPPRVICSVNGSPPKCSHSHSHCNRDRDRDRQCNQPARAVIDTHCDDQRLQQRHSYCYRNSNSLKPLNGEIVWRGHGGGEAIRTLPIFTHTAVAQWQKQARKCMGTTLQSAWERKIAQRRRSNGSRAETKQRKRRAVTVGRRTPQHVLAQGGPWAQLASLGVSLRCENRHKRG